MGMKLMNVTLMPLHRQRLHHLGNLSVGDTPKVFILITANSLTIPANQQTVGVRRYTVGY